MWFVRSNWCLSILSSLFPVNDWPSYPVPSVPVVWDFPSRALNIQIYMNKKKKNKNIYRDMVIRSASATVCGNVLFNVSGNIKANTAAINETIP